jgi:hypothetical protein
MGNPYHRTNGQFGTKWEHAAFVKGCAKGIAIGVAMAAKALVMPVQFLWNLIKRNKRRDAA